MITALEASLWVYKGYYQTTAFDRTVETHSARAHIKFFLDYILIVFPGSETTEDWIHDLESIDATEDPNLGKVGTGFILGIHEITDMLSHLVTREQPVVVVGHSLGAPHGTYFMGLMKAAGMDLSKWKGIFFEPPRLGSPVLADLLKDVDIEYYKMNDDIVCRVPLGLDHIRELKQLKVETIPRDILPDRDHHCQLLPMALLLTK